MSKYWYLTAGKMKVFSLGLLILSVLAVNAHAQGILGTASSFAVLGAQTVTNTGATTLGGNLGVDPGSALTGTGTITLTGAEYAADPIAALAQADASTAYTTYSTKPFTTSLTGQDLGGLTLGVGVYNFSSSAQLTGALTLNFGGLNNQTIVFQIGSTLTTASASSVLIINAGTNDNVIWVVGSSATLGTTTSFAGDIVALTSVTMETGATDGCGSVVALTGAVTLDHNTISTGCTMNSSGTVTPVVGPGGTTVYVPEGGSPLLYLCFSLLPIGTMWAFRFRRSI
jgi:Ice-binding-like